MKNRESNFSLIVLTVLVLVSTPVLAEEQAGMFDGVDVGLVYSYNDNVPRAAYGYQRRDSILSATAGKSYRKSTGSKSQLVYRWDSSIDHYLKYEMLDHFRLGLRGAWQYRANGLFSTPTYSLLARVYHDNYRSSLRSGTTAQVGVSARKPVTDRVTVTGIVEAQQRDAVSTVFDTRNTSARLNIDYLVSQRSTVYLTYNHITGDITYSAPWVSPYTDPPLVSSYDDWVNDDEVFYTNWRAFRASGTTQVATLGFNYMLNEKSSLDISIVNARSNIYNGPYYTSNIMSVAWLKRL